MEKDQAIEHIRETPITQILSHYIPLKRKGQNSEALCPFHSDSNPSLKVSDAKGIYKCFACGAAGDAFRFVMEFKSLDFIEAVKEIADKEGFTIEEQHSKINPLKKAAFEINHEFWAFCQTYTKGEGKDLFQSFLKKRELPREIAESFGLCLAPPRGAFYREVQSSQEKVNLAMKIGLLKDGQYGPYEAFRHRILFPIFNSWKQIIAFGSRQLSQDEQGPKWG